MKTLICTMWVCLSFVAASAQTVVNVIDKGIRYCESTYPYDGGLLIANFGTEQLNPLNTEGKGYIVLHKDGKNEVLIPADGHLSAPKGMLVRDGYLYVCDVNKVMVYNLADKAAEPRTIALPEGNLFANDLVSEGDYLYVSVTNTDRIFRVDISRPGQPGQPQEWLSVAGPNGLLLHEGSLYVASYPADGRTTDAHVVYRIADLKNPVAEKWMEVPGQYDGLAVASDGKALYVTNWTPAQVSRIDLNTRQISPLDLKLPQALVGPADITVTGGYLYIPDLPNSRVVVVKE
ncbi:hypothetical protein H7U35_03460 [Mediterranea massiliensis]|uniref:Uncharacterized protein n=1 Tax=Mediterranea massiliensis TaxID=1841865 RepID=A0ABS2DXU3_9BACT|nr:hypothetical protein [Mediterranea massiliensis]MBM6734289.1 hypothetical protein [Mediterranea massiliensis]